MIANAPRRFFAVLLALVFVCLFAENALAQAPLKVTLGYSGRGGGQEVLVLNEDQGIFKKHGLEVDLRYIEGGSLLVQTMVAGEIPLAVSASPEFINGGLAGIGVKIIATSVNRYPYAIVTAKEITKPAELKGKKMAVSRFGSGSDFATRRALEHWGLVPDKDVAILQVGNTPSRLAALQAGSVQGAVISPSQAPKARGLGFNLIADLSELPVEYPHLVVATMPSLAKENPEVVRRFLRAYAEGIKIFKTQPEVAKRAMVKQLGPQKPDELEEAYRETSKLLTVRFVPSSKGIQNVLDELSPKNPKAKIAKPEEFMDARFVEELERSGYFDQLK